ncbi:uncharacterized protein LOC141649406 [Silene latifolia]|uniref:uncharacterized protein LOC141649406 n=1 Tax=Silene latifolia TaxID=37657 RepID=UPI003D76E469
MIKKGFAYKVKYYAHKLLHGSMKEHYSKLGVICQDFEQEYPNSIFTLCTNPHVVGSEPVFQRLFVCFASLKQGWLEGCRKLLCIDACFLKTFLGGQLISATGRDANEQMYPLAWAVVEGENNESYPWFFQQLKTALREEDGEGWTIISDEHQSIVSMVSKEFPRAEHRRCARHIFANWHKSYKGEEMKMMFWQCAKAYNQADFDEAVATMREVDPRAADAFIRCNPTLFCRAFINTRTTNDVIVNNMAETFNAYIINARSKHLIYMLEDIRTMLMQRLVTKKNEMEQVGGVICPKIQEMLEVEKEKAAYCTPLPSRPILYQVKDGNGGGIDELKVNLADRTCTCRKWDVTGVPCCHAIAAIFDIHAEAGDFVHEAYRKTTYLRAYNYPIVPCPGERHWPKVDAPMIPPPIKVGPGRPRKKRRRGPHEDPKRSGKLTKHGLEMTCSVCKSKDHNKRTCPQKGTLLLEPTPKRGRGRPRNVSTSDSNRATTSRNSQTNHEPTAHPSRLGRNGRVIKSNGRGGARGGRGSSRGGFSRQRVPQGLGVLFDGHGNAFTNPPNNFNGPRNIHHPPSQSNTNPTTQVSSNQI